MKTLIHKIFYKDGILKYIVAFCLTVVLALSMLIAAAFLPQTPILMNVQESLDLYAHDIQNNYIFETTASSKLDVGTDLMILRSSMCTNRRYLGAVLTNPIYFYDGLDQWEGVPETIARLSYDIPSDSVFFYSRYWMGFRVLMRLALEFFNYGQIKRYLAFMFFTLFTAAICSVSKNTNSRLAFWFALSIVLVRPYVMATSMQFTCCFLIAFVAMLLVPWLSRHEQWEGLFFMECGMMAMYFDFYTVPMVTVGFPLLYLCILKRDRAVDVTIKKILKNFGIWFAGYGFMWIAKLVLTSALTSDNALQTGLDSLFKRVGIEKTQGLEQYYSVKAAFDAVAEAVFAETTGMVVWLLGLGILLVVVSYKLLKGHASMKNLRGSVPYLLLAAVPFLWFVITKQPVAIHGYFQYRNIALSYWAMGVFLYFLFEKKEQACIN